MAASTQKQAKSALLYRYREVLAFELPWLDNVHQARAPKRLPLVLTRYDMGFKDRVTILPATPHTLHICFANHLLQAGYGVRTVQALPGHSDVFTTKIHTHVLNRGGRGVARPLDRLN